MDRALKIFPEQLFKLAVPGGYLHLMTFHILSVAFSCRLPGPMLDTTAHRWPSIRWHFVADHCAD